MDTSGRGEDCKPGCFDYNGLCGNMSDSNMRLGGNSGSWVFESTDGKKDGDIVYVGDMMLIRNLYDQTAYFESCNGGACGGGIHTRCTDDKNRTPNNRWFIEYTDDYKNTRQRYITNTGLWENI